MLFCAAPLFWCIALADHQAIRYNAHARTLRVGARVVRLCGDLTYNAQTRELRMACPERVHEGRFQR